jgi:hypothetical protein
MRHKFAPPHPMLHAIKMTTHFGYPLGIAHSNNGIGQLLAV